MLTITFFAISIAFAAVGIVSWVTYKTQKKASKLTPSDVQVPHPSDKLATAPQVTQPSMSAFAFTVITSVIMSVLSGIAGGISSKYYSK